MKGLFGGIALFFSSIFGPSVSTNPNSEKVQIEIIESDIKAYKRQIQLLEINETMDVAAKYLQISKYQQKIEALKLKAKEVKKVSELKRKWAKEDSVEILKKYPLTPDSLKKEDSNNMKLLNL